MKRGKQVCVTDGSGSHSTRSAGTGEQCPLQYQRGSERQALHLSRQPPEGRRSAWQGRGWQTNTTCPPPRPLRVFPTRLQPVTKLCLKLDLHHKAPENLREGRTTAEGLDPGTLQIYSHLTTWNTMKAVKNRRTGKERSHKLCSEQT